MVDEEAKEAIQHYLYEYYFKKSGANKKEVLQFIDSFCVENELYEQFADYLKAYIKDYKNKKE